MVFEITPPHHNVRPEYNTRTGQVDGMEEHYYFKKRVKILS
ncbi:HNH/endonuclease VII fold putative polymorphic toxin [Bacillus wiedmannii]|nr:HNH/endonuclease VII fold putative polymorphic toxin [Bacillus wiedmannii]